MRSERLAISSLRASISNKIVTHLLQLEAENRAHEFSFVLYILHERTNKLDEDFDVR
jgi:hypothetical protein